MNLKTKKNYLVTIKRTKDWSKSSFKKYAVINDKEHEQEKGQWPTTC